MKKMCIFLGIILLIFSGMLGCRLGEKTDEDFKDPVTSTNAVYRFYSAELEAWLNSHANEDTVTVLIGVKDNTWNKDFGMPDTYGEFTLENGMIVEESSRQRGIMLDVEEEKELLRSVTEKKLAEKEKTATAVLNLIGSQSRGASAGKANAVFSNITTTLTKQQILDLAAGTELIDGIEIADPDNKTDGIFDDMAPFNAEMKLSTVAHPKGLDGTGVGVFTSDHEGQIPDLDRLIIEEPNFNFDNYETIFKTTTSKTRHLAAVTAIVQSSAPDAYLYGSAYRLLPNPLSYNPAIYIGSNTAPNDITSGGTYNILDRDYDDYVYDTRMSILKSAGNFRAENPERYVNTPGKAYNVITVGAYNPNTNSVISCYKNPETGIEKPEIVTPTDCCTSVSTPLAAGFAACLMEGYYNRFKLRPALMKATLMAGATINVEGNAALSEYDGAGGVNFFNAAYNGNAWWWDGANGSYFNSDNKIFINANLTAGVRYRLAIAWLVPGSYAFTNKKPNMDIDLRVKYNGANITSSLSTKNSFEIVDFVAANTGTHQIEIKRYWNSGEGRVIMGMVLKRI